MKLICNGSELSEAFNKVIKAISGKTNIPILEGVKLMAYGNELKLIATDSAFTIENTIIAEILEEGEEVVKGKFTAELISGINNQSIELTAEKGVVNIKYEDSVVNVMCMNINEYPPVINITSDESIKLMGKDIKDIVKKTIYSAASDENNNPIAKGVLMEIEGNSIKMVALDGYRLSIAKKEVEGNYPLTKLIISAKEMKEIVKLIGDEDIINIHTDKKRVSFSSLNTTITCMLIDGDFINYNYIIPKSFNTHVTVIKDQLKEVLGRVSIIAKNLKSRMIKIDIKDNVMVVSSETEIGNIKEQIPIKQEGNDVSIGVNCSFIIDCIEAAADEYILISLVDGKDPIVIENLDNKDYLSLILPIRVG